MHARTISGSVLVLMAVSAAWALAPLGTVFTYQGRLDDGGSPANGTYDLRFTLFDQLLGGAPQGATVCIDNVAVADGMFTVELDFGAQFSGQARYLEIAVRADTGLGCVNSAGFVTLGPRQALTAAPQALFATNADTLDGLESSAFLQTIPVPLTLSGTSSTHIIRGVNAADTVSACGVFGRSSALAGYTWGVLGQSDSANGAGVRGYASAAGGTTSGVYGECASADGYAVQGVATATSGTNYGGLFTSHSTGGRGVYGYAVATSGFNCGVYGQSNSPDGYGVFGVHAAGTGATAGVFGRTDSATPYAIGVHGVVSLTAPGGYSTAVRGENHGGGGSGIGVWGSQAGAGWGGYFTSIAGRGVYAQATASSGETHAVYGENSSTSGIAVYGLATAPSGTTYGVYGQTSSSSGWGVWSQGRMGASGTKSFVIDHPLDPQNKYLQHYCAEGPEPLNCYSGTVTTDAEGAAWVTLPDYFASINRGFRYSLTVVEDSDSGDFVQAKVARKIAGNRFKIRTSAPGVEVSWRVEAVRDDAWVRAYGAPSEVVKPEADRGRYLHPELYGQPSEMGIRCRPAPPEGLRETPTEPAPEGAGAGG